MGGIATGPTGETDVPGLFAAGEVVGGTNGANRQDGNALGEAMVFGPITGRIAATRAKTLKSPDQRKMAEGWVNETVKQLDRGRDRHASNRISPAPLRKRLRKIMWNAVGVVRNAAAIERAIAEIEGIQDGIRKVEPRTPSEFRAALEAMGETTTARIIAQSAFRRKESRGSHLREDFPETDDNQWLANTFVRKKGEELSFEDRPIGHEVPLFHEKTVHDGVGE
jgi:succinate dehydrogenase/fumarate reductase flavoprotein subunit